MLKNKVLMLIRTDRGWNFPVLLAVMFVAFILVYVFGHMMLSDRGGKALVTQQAAPSEAMVKVTEAINQKLPQAQNDMAGVDLSVFAGRWVSVMGNNKIAELVFSGDQFEVIYTADPYGRLRKYSRGHFSYNKQKGVLSLRPSRAIGKPEPIKGVTYSVLTMRAFDIEVKQQSGDGALYFIAEKETVLSKRVHPLFLYADYTGAPVLKFSKAQ